MDKSRRELHYCEGANSLVLHCGWGLSPPSVFVPSATTWDTKVPDWLRGRQDGIVGRIETHSGHVVASADWAY
ncbi:MAG TPA: hypothetical protein VEK80_18975 [Kribbellaceae bacterium]|nr:hypothetical protein [Kribbellaceae bacterium]